METIGSITCSISNISNEKHFIDKSTYSPCTSTHNVHNTNVAISLLKECAEKPQDEVLAKLDSPLRFKKNKKNKISLQKKLFEMKH